MKVFVLIAALLVGSVPSRAQDTLRLLSWNIQMLPFPASPHGKAKRAKAVADLLAHENYDVVVFQEAFKRRSRRILKRELKRVLPYQTTVLNQKTLSIKTNGGVMIFSKHRIDSVHEIRFIKRTGFDKYARKGAMMAEITIGGRTVQIVGTHLQAFGTDDVLISQYHQIQRELLAPHTRAGVPQFLLGDFNTRKTAPFPANLSSDGAAPQTRYSAMLQTLEAADGELEGDQQYTMDRPYNDLCIKRKEARLLLDYVLVRPNGTDATVIREVKILRKQWHPDHRDLSDHFALEAVVIRH